MESIVKKDFISQYTEKNPIWMFNDISDKYLSSQEYLLCSDILLTTLAIDEVITKLLGKNYIYIQDDSSVKYLIEYVRNDDLNIDVFNRCIFFLDLSKLLYRFTCAKKFNIEDLSVKQLRINSWGKSYAEEILSNSPNQYSQYYYSFKSICEKDFVIYYKLVELLAQNINCNTANSINKLNNLLHVKLLS